MNMKILKVIGLGMVIGASVWMGCEDRSDGLNFPLEKPDHIDSADYEVYSFVLDEIFSAEKIVISQESASHIRVRFDSDYFDYFVDKFPEFDTTLVGNLNEVNDTSCYFADKFHSDDNQLILVSPETLSDIFDSKDVHANWQEFYRRFENAAGYIKFSRIGFNEDKTQAMLEAGYLYGGTGAEGSIIYLVKQRGSWKIADRVTTWVS